MDSSGRFGLPSCSCAHFDGSGQEDGRCRLVSSRVLFIDCGLVRLNYGVHSCHLLIGKYVFSRVLNCRNAWDNTIISQRPVVIMEGAGYGILRQCQEAVR